MILRYTCHVPSGTDVNPDDIAVHSSAIVAIVEDTATIDNAPVAHIVLISGAKYVVRDVKRDAIRKWELAEQGY